TKMVNIADSVSMRQATATLRLDGKFHSADVAGKFNRSALIIASFSNSFVLPVRIVRVFQVPQWTSAAHGGHRFEVVFRRRRSRGPLKRPRIPGVISRLFALARRPENVPCQTGNGGDLKHYSN